MAQNLQQKGSPASLDVTVRLSCKSDDSRS